MSAPNTGAEAHRIFFLHNPKAGGSSLRAIFGNLFTPDAVAPVFSNAPNDHRATNSSISDKCGYAFYAGHYGYGAFRKLSEDHFLITNFRDPVERVISIYRYWRNNVRADDLIGLDPRDAAIVMLAHELDFSSFIRCPDVDLRLFISNFHFRQLHHSGWETAPVRPWDKWIVKHRISRMPWFYVAEMPRASALLLAKAFPELAGVEIPRENNSQGEQISIDPEDVGHLVQLNRLDYEIFLHAIGTQGERFRSLR